MFSNEDRCILRKNQLGEVICQLRFPEILKIETELPAAFQEHIRDEFPQFSKRLEAPAGPQTATPKQSKINYQFASPDGVWRVNLSSGFISLACNRYTCWEDFAKKLDKPLAAFIQTYKPAYFHRIGLRYINFISRQNLSLEDMPFRDLFQNMYLGPLADDEIAESAATRCSVDAEFAIRGGCKVKVHAGPGMLLRKTPNGTQQDKEVRFIFDQDLYMNGNVPVNYSAGALQTLHSQAYSIFRGAITDILFDAMDPAPIP